MVHLLFLILGVLTLSLTAEAQVKPLGAQYPGDRGIAGDPDVIFACDFESADLSTWDENQHPSGTALVSDPGLAFSGQGAVQMRAVLGESTGGGLIKRFQPGFDTVFARFYVKFAADHDYVHHFVHLLGERKPGQALGKAGLRPNGDDWFTTGVEPSGFGGRYPAPGIWNFYTYWPEMKHSGDGKYWGNSFASREPIQALRDRWTCVEMAVKCNTPGQVDGVEDYWIDGREAGPFTGFRWRTTPELKVSAFWLLHYVTDRSFALNRQARPNPVNTVWFDNVVVAKRYIGPMTGQDGGRPASGGSAVAPPPGWGPREHR